MYTVTDKIPLGPLLYAISHNFFILPTRCTLEAYVFLLFQPIYKIPAFVYEVISSSIHCRQVMTATLKSELNKKYRNHI